MIALGATDPEAAALVLAGGRSRRFGSEKAMAQIGGRPLIAYAVDAMAACGLEVAVSARAGSGAAAWAGRNGLPVLADIAGDGQGPLAGVRAGLLSAADRGFQRLLTAPCDLPAITPEVLLRLLAAARPGEAVYAASPGGDHPLCAVWPMAAEAALREALADGRHPSVRSLLSRLEATRVEFADDRHFWNANSPESLRDFAGSAEQ